MTDFDPGHLLDVAAYPHRVRRVDLVETHISWVFIAGDRVYKVKKPVDFGFLDYSSLRRRKRFCEEEVRLNRRLCPNAYLGVEKIVDTPGGLRIGGPGRALEYAVVMQRLPARRMLDSLIRTGHAGESLITRVAERVAAFHAGARNGPDVAQFGSIESVRANWDENFDQIRPFIGRTISAQQLRAIRQYVDGFIDRHPELFRQRQREGRIRDGHGDMRAESICVTDGLCIFDCIEFSEQLRCGDIASEAAFLAMDIDARGRPDLGYWLIDRYVETSGDRDLRRLQLFYASYRAFVRGKVQSFRLEQPADDERVHRTAQRRARHYLRLASLYARVPERPLLVLAVGLSGTGKTTLARSLGMRLGATVYSSDRVRKDLAGLQPTDRSRDEIDAGLYTAEMSSRVYAEMRDLAASVLRAGGSVVLDATYRTRDERAAILDLARSLNCPVWIVECRLPEVTALERIASRVSSGEGASDADARIYLAQRSRFEPIQPQEAHHLIVDTSKSIATVLNRALEPILRSIAA